MGCDIHLYAEKRVNGAWIAADTWTDDPYEPGTKEVAYEARFYTGRNYDLFAMLADVRNGRGFAGIRTGDGFNPIASPKGLPDDCSPEVRAESDGWGVDGHSHSFLTVAELMAYDWTQTTRKAGVVGYHELARWALCGRPESWSGSIVGGGVTHHDGAEAIEKIRAIEPDLWKLFHGYAVGFSSGEPTDRLSPDTRRALEAKFGPRPVFNIEWSVAYLDPAQQFLGTTLPRLWRLGAPEDVRIVFWFDN